MALHLRMDECVSGPVTFDPTNMEVGNALVITLKPGTTEVRLTRVA